MAGTAIVTGGNKGIGYFIVKRLVKNASLQCIFTSRTKANGTKALESLRKEGVDMRRVHFQVLDVSKPESIDVFVKWTTATHPKIDMLVNNAGFAFKGSSTTPFKGQAAPTFAVNFFGLMALTEKLRPLLVPGARIVNVASQAGTSAISKISNPAINQRLSQPESLKALAGDAQKFVQLVADKGEKCVDQGFPATCYGMSKAFVIAYTRELARAGLNAFSCCPGWCKTDMSSNRGPRSADKGAETPAWLAVCTTPLKPGAMYYDLKEIKTGLLPLK